MHELKKDLKRLLSIVLVAVMFLSFMPVNAIAADLPDLRGCSKTKNCFIPKLLPKS